MGLRYDDGCGFDRGSVLGGRCLRHGFEEGDGLAFGPAASYPLPDGQHGQRVGESIGGWQGAPAGLGGRC